MISRALILAAVAAGAALGGLVRGALAVFAPVSALPWPTLAANIAGSLLIGFYAGRVMRTRRLVSDAERHFVIAGVCGGMTTFSVFSLETVALATGGAWALAGGYAAVSLAAWLLASAAGWRLGHGSAAAEQA